MGDASGLDSSKRARHTQSTMRPDLGGVRRAGKSRAHPAILQRGGKRPRSKSSAHENIYRSLQPHATGWPSATVSSDGGGQGLLKNAADAQAGLAFAQHVLDGMFVRFEDARIEKRFDLPDFSVFPHPGGGAFHVLCRLYADNEADLWFHVSHVLQDGKPVLEAFEDLKKEWGVRGATILPAPMENTATPMIPANCDSGRDMAYVQQFLSFESLLETRKKLNERFASVLKGNITLAGMLLWGLSQHPFLTDAKMTTVVDVPPDPKTGEARTLGYVTTRPRDFLSDGDRERGFVHYQNHLNRAIELVRQRLDLPYAAMKGQALMPVESYEMTLKSVPQAVRDIGGKVTLTVIPSAEYCAANADDSRDALIAIGNVTLPTEAGGRGGVVSVKAIKEDARRYVEAIFNAVTKWRI